MIHKTDSSRSGHINVTFELPACVWADQVFLVGDFNNWDEANIPFRQDRNGVWRATVDLPVGQRFRFRYLVDGSWRTDYHADGQEGNDYNTTDSVIETVLSDTEKRGWSERPSMIHEKHKIAVRESFHRQMPPNRRAA
jgi:1,4-alpha-glucan branching enzyme